MATEAFQFYAGPVDGPGGPLPRIAAWPVNPAYIEAILADPAQPLGFRALARANQAGGADEVTVGLHAMEYLLWGEAGSRRPDDFAGDGRRAAMLAAQAQVLANDLGLLVAAWAPEGNTYRAATLAMDQRNALGRAFNGMAVLLGYEIPLRRIGAGLFPGNPGFEPSPFSQSSAQDLRASFDGARRVWTETGLAPLVAARDAALAQAIDTGFARAAEAVAAMDAPYSRFLAPPPGSPERATAGAAVRALTDLGRDLRTAANRLGVLVVIPGL
jgi:putative iron-regulated protein